MWRDLKTDPPTGDRPVVLFPLITDVGILYQTSNPDYARTNALRQGYTSWMDIPEHPVEKRIVQKINEAEATRRSVEVIYEPAISELLAAMDATDGDPSLDILQTAHEVLCSMIGYGIAVPLMSVRADAVVFLWMPLDGRTIALTVTDDEVGLVVRRDRQRERMESGISIYDFDYENLKSYVGHA